MANSKSSEARENGERKMDMEKIAAGVRLILEGIGEDPDRPGLAGTPDRIDCRLGNFGAERSEITDRPRIPIPHDRRYACA